MSLDAIAALLGHRSPRMTLVYTRIADTKVAGEHFNATSAVEADAAAALTAGAAIYDPPATWRLLANGHCTRPQDLDCRFQTICEGCGFFETGPEFVPILRRQRDDAAGQGDRTRMRLYDELVRVIDEQEAAASSDRPLDLCLQTRFDGAAQAPEDHPCNDPLFESRINVRRCPGVVIGAAVHRGAA